MTTEQFIPTAVVALYLCIVAYIGIFAFRKSGTKQADDYFLASRSLGQFVFLLSLFGTNMTAFTILGSSQHSNTNGIVTYGLMGSSSAIVIPLCLYLIGTRMWALGKRFGFITPVQMFRDRWECGHIGTVIFVALAALLVPYILIGILGGGSALEQISRGLVPKWAGGAVVALVVMSYVFFGGMRGTAWVNTFQTILFLAFGGIALIVIGNGMGGFDAAIRTLQESPKASLLTRENVAPEFFLSYMLIPLSAIAFPHITIFCLTAKKMSHFKKTIIFYPLCILAIWLPCIFLGVVANAETNLQPGPVVVQLLNKYAPIWLAGMLGAGIMAAVMAADSQILALSTMFTEDVFAFYGGKQRFGQSVQVQTGRIFVILVTVIAYVIAQFATLQIFDLAVQYAFSGFSALAPLYIGALFWKRSTKWGALAATVFVLGAVLAVAILQYQIPAPAPGQPPVPVWSIGDTVIIARGAVTTIFGFLTVVPMVIISSILLIVVSLITPRPSDTTLARYFTSK